MNSSGLVNNSLAATSLGRMDALRAQAGVSSGVGGVSPVDDNSMAPQGPEGGHVNHQNHSSQHSHLHLPHHHPHQQQTHDPQHHLSNFQQVLASQPGMVPLAESFGKVSDAISKLENEVATMNQDMAYFRHVLDFQNLKIDKLTLLLLDLIHNKDVSSIVGLLQSIQTSDPFNVDDNHDSVNDSHDSVDDSVRDSVHDLVHDSVHDVTAAIPSLQSLGVVSVPGVVNVLLDSNMDPQLHQVAQAAVQAQSASKVDILDDKKSRKRTFVKINGNSAVDHISKQQQTHQVNQSQSQLSQQQRLQQHQQQQTGSKDSMVNMPGLEVVNVDNMAGRKKPKVTIDFLHNPMTVKEIYDEFTKGFRGQIPLREMDERFGKHEWRGDSRSKESKRFQRRKKLCDAIERGMGKYGKSAEEIISYIEEFRGDKSLTWVMNGNLPRDLME